MQFSLISPTEALTHQHFIIPALRFPLYEPDEKDLVIVLAHELEGAGLGLAYGWGIPNGEYELISIYVTPLMRRQGMGAKLLSTLQTEFAAKGYRLGVHRYMMPVNNQGFARFLMANGWSYPVVRQLVCKGDLDGFYNTIWARVRMPKKFTIKGWSELTEAERQSINRRTEKEPGWYAHDQDPFVYEIGSHTPTSIAMLKDGEVVGWVLTHMRDEADSLRWTVSFVAPEFSRAGNILHLWRETGLRQRASTNLRYMTWAVPLTHPRMLDTVVRRMREQLLSMSYACTSMISHVPQAESSISN